MLVGAIWAPARLPLTAMVFDLGWAQNGAQPGARAPWLALGRFEEADTIAGGTAKRLLGQHIKVTSVLKVPSDLRTEGPDSS
jgi:hypothetical protein